MVAVLTTMKKHQYIKASAVRKYCKANGKRASVELFATLDRMIHLRLEACVKVHNGGKKTIDTGVLSYVFNHSDLTK
jgi:hypothetical protein